MNRRRFLVSSIMTALGVSACDSSSTSESPPPADEFDKAFAIPTELSGTVINGRVKYDLSIQSGSSRILDTKNTPTWGINGTFLGPTIRLKNGSNVDLNFTNNLTVDTTMHGHGMHLPAVMDGGPHQVIAPKATWTSSYTVNQRACTNWYHPHLMGKTAEHVMNGLAGMIIIDDLESESLDLPKTYGVDDIPVIVQDRRFNSDGSFDYAPSTREIMLGWKGDTYLVNGVIKPYIDVEAKQIRFRLLNGSNSRVYAFAFSSGRSFQQIATDNSFLENPVELSSLRLSPGERAEIVVDFSNEVGLSETFVDNASGSRLFKINIKALTAPSTTMPGQLTTLAQLDPGDAVVSRLFSLTGSMGTLYINNQTMDLSVFNETLNLNDVEIWEVVNEMNVVHNFHLHATHFQIIERNGSSVNVAENEKGYKDTVFISAGERVKFIVKMIDYADNTNPYMYHCHILEHEDAGMMGQFLVV